MPMPGEEKKVRHSIAVTPSDVTTYNPTDGIYAGGAGTLVLVFESGAEDTYTVQAGTLLPLSITKVKAASTATDIHACYG